MIIKLKLCKTLKILSKHNILTDKEHRFFNFLFFNSAICCFLDLVRQEGCKTNICWSKDQKITILSALNVVSIASHANHSTNSPFFFKVENAKAIVFLDGFMKLKGWNTNLAENWWIYFQSFWKVFWLSNC